LAGIAGHNFCFDFFGPPSDAEAAAGLSVHGEASVVDWRVTANGGVMHAVAELPQARMRVTRELKLGARAYAVTVTETVENLMDVDRVVGWTQHATLGPPFLEPGKTVFHMPATHSKVFEGDFAGDKERFVRGAEFEWPMAPLVGGGFGDMRPAAGQTASGAFTAHLMDPAVEQAFFTAFSPTFKTVFGYVWKRSDFPWLGIWEENRSRTAPPWNGKTITRGMEFGVSPIPETRQAMVDRGELFGERCYRWIPARSKVTVEYCFFIAPSDDEVTSVEWTNPHTYFYLDVADEDKNITRWAFEMGSPIVLQRRGWSPRSLKIGDPVEVDGFLARDGTQLVNASSVLLLRTGERLHAITAPPSN
jgi:hypothetical protein